MRSDSLILRITSVLDDESISSTLSQTDKSHKIPSLYDKIMPLLIVFLIGFASGLLVAALAEVGYQWFSGPVGQLDNSTILINGSWNAQRNEIESEIAFLVLVFSTILLEGISVYLVASSGEKRWWVWMIVVAIANVGSFILGAWVSVLW